jgi:hypothetical protein
MDTFDQMRVADTMVRQLVAELRASGMGGCVIASTLAAHAGSLWRDSIPDAADRRAVVLQAAEVAITGLPQKME